MLYTLWLVVSGLGLQALVERERSSLCEYVQCDLSLYQRYVQIGCTPKYLDGICCPTSYDCRQIDSSSRCDLPVVSMERPMCENISTIWAYDPVLDACEQQTLAGCHFSENAFTTLEECQEVCNPSLPAKPCAAVECDLSLYQHYIQRGCTPKYLDGACCPTSYDCPEPLVFDSKCFHDGKYYEIGESVPDLTPCRENCVCQLATEKENKTKITCSDVHCQGRSVGFPKRKFCTAVHEPADGCCASHYVNCEPFNNTATLYEFDLPSSNETRLPLCIWDGVEYVEGERFYPKTPDAPCQVCTCTREFKGIYGPGCVTATCEIQPPSSGCVPIYDEAVCCPIRYKCPSELTEVTIKVSSSEQNTEGAERAKALAKTTKKARRRTGARRRKKLEEDGSKNLSSSGEVCLEPPFVGPCRGQVPRYFYNHTADKCQIFLFGGCHAKENNFQTEFDCYVGCIWPLSDSRPGLRLPEACTKPKRKGDCKAAFFRFFYNQKKKKCESFIFGGCKGNQNSFDTLVTCDAICGEMGQLLKARSKNDALTIATAPYCLFGGVRFNLGQQLATKEKYVECTCVTPPELTCIRRKSFCPEISPGNHSSTPTEEIKKVPYWEELPVTNEITDLAFSHKADIEKELGFALQVFEPIKYKEEPSEGRKFSIDVRSVAFFTDKEEKITVLIQKNLDGTTKIVISAICEEICGSSGCMHACS